VTGKVLIGISGWRYEPWRGVFYPKGLAQHRELEYASRQFPSIEINGTFYSLQYPFCFDAWYDATPPGFLFAIKGSRFITHMKRLRDVERPLANFFASGLFRLREKMGPFLWQFPPNFRFNADLLEQFFDARPVRDGLVELEGELGHASQIESRGQRAPDEGQRAIERPRGFLPFGRIAQGGVVDARLLEVWRDRHARQRQKADAQIAHFTGEDVADFLPDLLGELDGA